jgi:hypothetical protein
MLAAPSPALALEVLSVQPSTILNTTEVSLVVTGSDFQSGATVVLEGVGALTTTFISNSVLNAVSGHRVQLRFNSASENA